MIGPAPRRANDANKRSIAVHSQRQIALFTGKSLDRGAQRATASCKIVNLLIRRAGQRVDTPTVAQVRSVNEYVDPLK